MKGLRYYPYIELILKTSLCNVQRSLGVISKETILIHLNILFLLGRFRWFLLRGFVRFLLRGLVLFSLRIFAWFVRRFVRILLRGFVWFFRGVRIFAWFVRRLVRFLLRGFFRGVILFWVVRKWWQGSCSTCTLYRGQNARLSPSATYNTLASSVWTLPECKSIVSANFYFLFFSVNLEF